MLRCYYINSDLKLSNIVIITTCTDLLLEWYIDIYTAHVSHTLCLITLKCEGKVIYGLKIALCQ